MRKLIILLILISFTAFGQSPDTVKTKRFSIGLTFSPDYCYRILIADASSQWIANIRDNSETPKFGYTTGLNFAQSLNNKIAVESGLLFSDKGERNKPLLTDINGNLMGEADFNYHYEYMDIPFKIIYSFVTRRTKIFLSGGISLNIFLRQRITSVFEYAPGYYGTFSSVNNKDYARINLAILIGLGFSYEISKSFYLKIEPTHRHSITSIIDAPIKSYLYSIGINTGLYYKL